uniref:Uncharacterized protein n=1 Tax=viral metagenome TaxID=1070528 RepID=A0A6C0F845_9ZZZZ|tara:strand:+ start:5165 stop:5692 length:528 start_codon:yes stop_codon:yes gene_type:complete
MNFPFEYAFVGSCAEYLLSIYLGIYDDLKFPTYLTIAIEKPTPGTINNLQPYNNGTELKCNLPLYKLQMRGRCFDAIPILNLKPKICYIHAEKNMPILNLDSLIGLEYKAKIQSNKIEDIAKHHYRLFFYNIHYMKLNTLLYQPIQNKQLQPTLIIPINHNDLKRKKKDDTYNIK